MGSSLDPEFEEKKAFIPWTHVLKRLTDSNKMGGVNLDMSICVSVRYGFKTVNIFDMETPYPKIQNNQWWNKDYGISRWGRLNSMYIEITIYKDSLY